MPEAELGSSFSAQHSTAQRVIPNAHIPIKGGNVGGKPGIQGVIRIRRESREGESARKSINGTLGHVGSVLLGNRWKTGR